MSDPKVQEFIDELHKTFPHLKFNVDTPTVGGCHYIDVVHNGTFVWCLQVEPWEGRPNMLQYGLSIVDDDAAFTHHADMVCGHAPTFLKYLKMLLPSR